MGCLGGFLAVNQSSQQIKLLVLHIFFVVMNPPDCDEGRVVDRRAINARGDVVMEYERA
jgi:hypothetical protein